MVAQLIRVIAAPSKHRFEIRLPLGRRSVELWALRNACGLVRVPPPIVDRDAAMLNGQAGEHRSRLSQVERLVR